MSKKNEEFPRRPIACFSQRSKKGGMIGGTIVMLVAIVVIVIILTIFVLTAGIVKLVENVESGLKVHDESLTDIDNVFTYMSYDYKQISKTKVLFAQGIPIKDSALEVSYDE